MGFVPVAQLDRASDFGSEGWGFDSSQARKNTFQKLNFALSLFVMFNINLKKEDSNKKQSLGIDKKEKKINRASTGKKDKKLIFILIPILLLAIIFYIKSNYLKGLEKNKILSIKNERIPQKPILKPEQKKETPQVPKISGTNKLLPLDEEKIVKQKLSEKTKKTKASPSKKSTKKDTLNAQTNKKSTYTTHSTLKPQTKKKKTAIKFKPHKSSPRFVF